MHKIIFCLFCFFNIMLLAQLTAQNDQLALNNERLSQVTFLEVTKVLAWSDCDLDGFTFITNDGSVWYALSWGKIPAIEKYNLQTGQLLAFIPLPSGRYGIAYFNGDTLTVKPVFRR